jgi:hypothetical protein
MVVGTKHRCYCAPIVWSFSFHIDSVRLACTGIGEGLTQIEMNAKDAADMEVRL